MVAPGWFCGRVAQFRPAGLFRRRNNQGPGEGVAEKRVGFAERGVDICHTSTQEAVFQKKCNGVYPSPPKESF